MAGEWLDYETYLFTSGRRSVSRTTPSSPRVGQRCCVLASLLLLARPRIATVVTTQRLKGIGAELILSGIQHRFLNVPIHSLQSALTP